MQPKLASTTRLLNSSDPITQRRSTMERRHSMERFSRLFMQGLLYGCCVFLVCWATPSSAQSTKANDAAPAASAEGSPSTERAEREPYDKMVRELQKQQEEFQKH